MRVSGKTHVPFGRRIKITTAHLERYRLRVNFGWSPKRVFLLALLLAGEQAVAQQVSLGATEGLNARPFSRQVGRHLTFVCSATRPGVGTVYGTDIYSDSSAICQAAIHAGVLAANEPGPVTFVMGAGVETLDGNARNGVTSESYGSWDSTYTFVQDGEPGQIDWMTTAYSMPVGFSAPIALACPPGGDSRAQIWGTDTYTESSPICVAAVHAGLITAADGGRFTLVPAGEQPAFLATTRNGIESTAWSAYPGSFRLSGEAGVASTGRVLPIAATTSVPSIVTEGAPISSGPRTVAVVPSGPRSFDLAGFAAAGTGAALPPHAFELTGFAASGTGTAFPPHSFDLAGFTASGTGVALLPHSFELTGFSASGTGDGIAPHTFDLAGFTASGTAPRIAPRSRSRRPLRQN